MFRHIKFLRGIFLKLNVLLVVKSDNVFKSCPCCFLDHHDALFLLLEFEFRPIEDILEMITVQGQDDLVCVQGGYQPVLLVHHLELDVARDGGGGGEESGEDGPIKIVNNHC